MNELIILIGNIDLSGYNDLSKYPHKIEHYVLKMFLCTILLVFMMAEGTELVIKGHGILGCILLYSYCALHYGSLFYYRKKYMTK